MRCYHVNRDTPVHEHETEHISMNGYRLLAHMYGLQTYPQFNVEFRK